MSQQELQERLDRHREECAAPVQSEGPRLFEGLHEPRQLQGLALVNWRRRARKLARRARNVKTHDYRNDVTPAPHPTFTSTMVVETSFGPVYLRPR